MLNLNQMKSQTTVESPAQPSTFPHLHEEMRKDRNIVCIKEPETARKLPIQSHADISKKQQTQVDSITTSL